MSPRPFALLAMLALTGLAITACSDSKQMTPSLADAAAPEETVLSVPGMH